MPGGTPSVGSIGPARGPFIISRFYVPANQPTRYVISGVTKSSVGAVLPGCSVTAYETVTKLQAAPSVISDANGVYTISVQGATGLKFFVVAYLAGSPDVEGTTVNTLVPVGA
jgi:hypothetical protein